MVSRGGCVVGVVWMCLLSAFRGHGALLHRAPFLGDEFVVSAYMDEGGHDWACNSRMYTGHKGTDFALIGRFEAQDEGRDIVASAPGVVLHTEDGHFDRCGDTVTCSTGGYGNYVRLQHVDGTQTFYGHLRKNSVAVEESQAVACGQKVGQGGSSGHSTGPHLHFEIRDLSTDSTVFRDPYAGPCGPSQSMWSAQGEWGGLPGSTCGALSQCTLTDTLTCGANVSTSTAGAGSSLFFYGCSRYTPEKGHEWFTYSGPELLYGLRTSLDEDITVAVEQPSADVDLYVMRGTACDATDCLAASISPSTNREEVVFSAEKDQEYVVAVDGFKGVSASFRIVVSCKGKIGMDQDHDDTAVVIGVVVTVGLLGVLVGGVFWYQRRQPVVPETRDIEQARSQPSPGRWNWARAFLRPLTTTPSRSSGSRTQMVVQ